MRSASIILFSCCLFLTSGCSSQSSNNQTSSSPTTSTAATPTPNVAITNASTPSEKSAAAIAKLKVDACSVLTSADIQAVQGEPLKDTKPSDRRSENFITAICYYELPTASNSISLSLTQNDPDKQGQTVKDFWKERFGKSEPKNEEREKDRAEKKKEPQLEKRTEGEEEESASLEPVNGIGDEAFWSGSRVGGALYVLKGERYLRISVGGAGDKEAKLKKSKQLAQKAVRKM